MMMAYHLGEELVIAAHIVCLHEKSLIPKMHLARFYNTSVL